MEVRLRAFRAVMAGAVAAAVTAVAGCGGEVSTATPRTRPLQVGLVYDIGGRGDQSYNDAAAAGVDEAKRNLKGMRVREVEAAPGEPATRKVERVRALAAAGYDPIIAVGYSYAPALARIAPRFPRTRFAIVDEPTVKGPNITNLLFASEQGSFLMGAAAAMKSRTGDVGFVGGNPSPLVRKFEVGYVQGVKHVNPRVRIRIAYLTGPHDLNGFYRPDKAEKVARRMYRAGADVVYQVAGASGAGVFRAANDAGAWAIGVDYDQAKSADPAVRHVIMTSMIKRIDVAVYDYLAGVADHTVTSGPVVYDLRRGGVDYSLTGGHIDDIQPRLELLKQEIIHGRVKVSPG
ncbi:BMP family ABC transporter substrate-binding protein [Microbispora hainanensis]|jgi:basic membrane protein A|uniref:BMP family lipoprotein n=1 Tax=Microbispora TaxID=2005 RepID=UPI00197BB6A2|nr:MULTISPECIES: BMP family ABC transporter substrate-binding protein [Microbispora]